MPGETFICINCGEEVKDLYKQYSAGVLKLTECECHNIADKYVEYDLVIIIIDLILLRMMAYRHVLHNTHFKHFWKLSIILILLETYSDWIAVANANVSNRRHNDSIDYPKFNLTDVDLLEDFKFYKLCVNSAFKTLCFVLVAFVLTKLYRYYRCEDDIPFYMIWKTITISSGGIFLLLPSLIWDLTAQELHIHVVSLYTTLSQLIAYRAVCNCTKFWSLIVIFSSYCCKTFVFDLF